MGNSNPAPTPQLVVMASSSRSQFAPLLFFQRCKLPMVYQFTNLNPLLATGSYPILSSDQLILAPHVSLPPVGNTVHISHANHVIVSVQDEFPSPSPPRPHEEQTFHAEASSFPMTLPPSLSSSGLVSVCALHPPSIRRWKPSLRLCNITLRSRAQFRKCMSPLFPIRSRESPL